MAQGKIGSNQTPGKTGGGGAEREARAGSGGFAPFPFHRERAQGGPRVPGGFTSREARHIENW